MKYKYLSYIFILALISACQPEIDEFTPDQGTADFSRFIAVGNSLTAGYTDGALYEQGQKYSFPNLMATQFSPVGGGEFKQPLLSYPDGIGLQTTPMGTFYIPRLTLQKIPTCTGEAYRPAPADPSYINKQQEMAAALMTPVSSQGPFNNIGVPSLKSFHMLIPGYDTLNPYYFRFASGPVPGDDTLIAEIRRIDPTFFSVWIGNNDLLDYALAGGEEGGPAHKITTVGPDPVFGHPGYAESMNTVLTSLADPLAHNAKGILINVPDILMSPYFNTIPYNGLILRRGQADTLNMAYAQVPNINFDAGPNPFVIEDPGVQTGMRFIEEGEHILAIVLDSVECKGYGSAKPIPGKYVLTHQEVSNIHGAINEYNSELQDIITKFPANVAYLDFHALLKQAHETGIYADGIEFTTEGITGNLFGLDGLHLSPQGNALIAYYCIEAINANFDAQVPQVTITSFPSIVYP